MTQQVVDCMEQYMASAADTVVTKAKTICTAFPDVHLTPTVSSLVSYSTYVDPIDLVE